MSKKRYKPGQKAPVSGQYRALVRKQRFGRLHHSGEVTVVAGEPFPPRHEEGIVAVVYELADATKHGS